MQELPQRREWHRRRSKAQGPAFEFRQVAGDSSRCERWVCAPCRPTSTTTRPSSLNSRKAGVPKALNISPRGTRRDGLALKASSGNGDAEVPASPPPPSRWHCRTDPRSKVPSPQFGLPRRLTSTKKNCAPVAREALTGSLPGRHASTAHFRFRFSFRKWLSEGACGLVWPLSAPTMAYRGQGQKVQKVMVQPIVSYAWS